MERKYDIRISATAEKQFKRIPRKDQERIGAAILNLSTNPFPRGARKLAGCDDIFRIRVGMYRVVYSVEAAIITIVILKIGHRKDVYRPR